MRTVELLGCQEPISTGAEAIKAPCVRQTILGNRDRLSILPEMGSLVSSRWKASFGIQPNTLHCSLADE